MKAYTNIENSKELIDYASLYGVKPNENDFNGAIQRCVKEGPKHLSQNFVKTFSMIKKERIDNKLKRK